MQVGDGVFHEPAMFCQLFKTSTLKVFALIEHSETLKQGCQLFEKSSQRDVNFNRRKLGLGVFLHKAIAVDLKPKWLASFVREYFDAACFTAVIPLSLVSDVP